MLSLLSARQVSKFNKLLNSLVFWFDYSEIIRQVFPIEENVRA